MGSESAEQLAARRAEVRALVLTGLGVNCEAETAEAFRMAGARPDLLHLLDLVAEPARLRDYRVLAFVGGFSFGDHIAAGKVYALKLRYRLFDEITRFLDEGGLALGICNGFQTLVKLGLLPALGGERGRPSATLAPNDRLGYRDAWVRLRAEPASPCVWTRGLDRLFLPARHGEGKFVARDEETLGRIEEAKLVALRYADAYGRPTQRYPDNPNGSARAIAGLCDPSGRVFGLMPHPEGYLTPYHHPRWTRLKAEKTLPAEGGGLAIFRRGVDAAAGIEVEPASGGEDEGGAADAASGDAPGGASGDAPGGASGDAPGGASERER